MRRSIRELGGTAHLRIGEVLEYRAGEGPSRCEARVMVVQRGFPAATVQIFSFSLRGTEVTHRVGDEIHASEGELYIDEPYPYAE